MKSKPLLEEMYRKYLKEVVLGDKGFDIKETEDFDDWIERKKKCEELK